MALLRAPDLGAMLGPPQRRKAKCVRGIVGEVAPPSRVFALSPQITSSFSCAGSAGNGAWGSVWYQNTVEAMSSWSGR